MNGIDRRQSTVANVEGGIHNTAYMGDSLDSSDVIMMMDSSKKNGSAVSNAKNGKNGDMSSSLKVRLASFVHLFRLNLGP